MGLVQPLCASNCSAPHGECVPAVGPRVGGALAAGAACQCEPGFAGDMCEGKLIDVELGQPVSGTLQQAEWVYFRLELTVHPPTPPSPLRCRLSGTQRRGSARGEAGGGRATRRG